MRFKRLGKKYTGKGSCTETAFLFYRYLSISFYRLRSFETFLKLLETGIISVSFKLGYFKSGEHYGEIYDHGTSFDISKEDLEKLFEPIYLDLYSNVVRIGMTNVQS